MASDATRIHIGLFYRVGHGGTAGERRTSEVVVEEGKGRERLLGLGFKVRVRVRGSGRGWVRCG